MEVKDNEIIGLKTIIVQLLLRWKLFLSVFLFSLAFAVLYLLYYPRTYEIMARIQILEEKGMGSSGFGLGETVGLMKTFGLSGISSGSINIDDELQALTSNQLMREMVLALGLQAEYAKPYTWGYRLYEDTPFRMTADSLTNARLDEEIEFDISMQEGNVYLSAQSVNLRKKHFTFDALPALIELPMGIFVLDFAPGKDGTHAADLDITYRPASWVAEDLLDEFLVEESSKSSHVIELSCTDYKKKRGTDMLSTLIALYNEQADSYKREEAKKTLLFFDGRIQDFVQELRDVEYEISSYKHENKLMDIEHDARFYLDQVKDLQSKQIELEGQLNVIDLMDAFIKDPVNAYNLIPILLTVQEGEKKGGLTGYNEVLLERARIIQNSSLNNPLVGMLSKQADQLRAGVIETIGNARKGLELSIADIRSKEELIYGKINNFPAAERQFVELKRQQEINQGVYLVLLQKREEIALLLGQSREKARVVDTAYVKSKPVAPRKLYAAIGVCLFTLIISVGSLFVKEQVRALCELYRSMR